MNPDSLFSGMPLKLLFFGGKGGVGKTTCAVSFALRQALKSPGASMLIVSTDPAHSLRDSLDGLVPPENLLFRELDAEACLKSFREKHGEKLKQIAARGTFFDDTDIDQLLQLSLPGLDELMGFLEISTWAETGGFDTIVVDTAPTGHTLRLLEMPTLIGKWLDVMDTLLAKHRYMKNLFQGGYRPDELDRFLKDFAKSIKTMERLLSDTNRCRFVPVLVAEQLSLLETRQLRRRLKAARIPVSDMVLNRMLPDNGCPVCAGGRERQLAQVESFSGVFSGTRLWAVPLYPEEIKGKRLVEAFWQGADEFELSRAVPAPTGTPPAAPPRVESRISAPDAELKLILFAGKGGVGKTSLACAAACFMAESFGDKQVLIFSTDPAHSLSQCMDMPIGPVETRIGQRLWGMEMDARALFDEFKKYYRSELKSFLAGISSNIDFAFDQQAMERVMELAPPGLDELMALTTIMSFLSEGRYDCFILDSAPTGHLLRLLNTPEIMDQWLKVLFTLLLKYKNVFHLPGLTQKLVRMSKDLKLLKKVLSDPNQSALYAVSVLTRMAFEETRDLLCACKALGIKVPVLFLNMAARESACTLCAAVHRRESAIREKFSAAFPLMAQPLIYRQREPIGWQALEALGAAVFEGGTPAPPERLSENLLKKGVNRPCRASNLAGRPIR